jgi:hypothetical protein
MHVRDGIVVSLARPASAPRDGWPAGMPRPSGPRPERAPATAEDFARVSRASAKRLRKASASFAAKGG